MPLLLRYFLNKIFCFLVTDKSKEDENPEDPNKEQPPKGSDKDEATVTPCPLCQEPFSDYSVLESHVMQLHSVNSDGLKRLLMLMEGSHWLNNSRMSQQSVSAALSDTDGSSKDYSADKLEKGKANNFSESL